MTTLRTLKKLLLGETWVLPLGLAGVVMVVALAVRPWAGDGWRHVGGFLLLAGVLAVLTLSVARSGGRR